VHYNRWASSRSGKDAQDGNTATLETPGHMGELAEPTVEMSTANREQPQHPSLVCGATPNKSAVQKERAGAKWREMIDELGGLHS